ncbi:hypothetical protein Cgig2_016579 [Carnegiea gigantea]|uniref:Xylanase inhibitor N-terminal domain-containing protein n=1 Tax=Carnegiea gigantea TaxID=171969 RepID=A0A9Q1KZZ9_9CARY|nr:hypothetical protein Cgig2_016579 [Carnegiea gigantea]
MHSILLANSSCHYNELALTLEAAYDDLDYKSTTFRPIPCGSTKCSAYSGSGCVGCNAKPSPSCTNNTCGADGYTPWSDALYSSGLIHDKIFLYTHSKNLSKVLQYPMSGFPFACADKGPLKGMSPNAKGILTLANVNITFHSVVSKTSKVPHKLALCLRTTDTLINKGLHGALYVGGGPYYMSKESHRDFSKSLVTTPLVVNPKSTTPISGESDKSVKYFINVKAPEVGGTPLKIDSSLLTINKNGVGGTKLSTLDPYTILHRNIYKALVDVFTAKAKAMNIWYMANTTSGPRVPTIDFVLNGQNAS